LNPDFILVGESDPQSGQILESFYKDVCDNDPPVKRMNIVNAEITKISLNTYVTTKISYANMLSELCEKVPGGNIDDVTGALGCDKRIGHKYLKGGVGYGGPCFPRDNRALMCTAKKFGVTLPIAEATDRINHYQIPRIVDMILSLLPEGGKVGILGLSYKTDTNVVEESQGVEIAGILAEKGVEVIAYDPAAMENARKALGNKIAFASSLKDCLSRGDLFITITPWLEFKEIEPEDLKREGNQPILIDCWRMLDPKKFEGVAKYFSIGVNH
jgi:UDPglucose 6-dehydrogenase